jgi:hypothetical protein
VRLVDRSQSREGSINTDIPASSVPEQSHHNVKNKTLDLTKKQLEEIPLNSLENLGFDVAHIKLGKDVIAYMLRLGMWFSCILLQILTL